MVFARITQTVYKYPENTECFPMYVWNSLYDMIG